MPEEFEESVVIKAMMELEGMTFEEATSSYAHRKHLPASAFCGPNRTYPCHNTDLIENAIDKLMKIKPKGWKNILRQVRIRGRKMNMNFGESKILRWYLAKHKPEKSREGCENGK